MLACRSCVSLPLLHFRGPAQRDDASSFERAAAGEAAGHRGCEHAFDAEGTGCRFPSAIARSSAEAVHPTCDPERVAAPSPENEARPEKKDTAYGSRVLVGALSSGRPHACRQFSHSRNGQAAAKAAWSSSNVVAFTCVKASTGKQGDPGPPPP